MVDQILDRASIRAGSVVGLSIPGTLAVANMANANAALLLMCVFCIAANFYVSVWLVRKNDSIVGGLPKATHSYYLGFGLLAAAYSSVLAYSLATHSSLLMRTAAVAFVLAGQVALLSANRQLFQAIAKEGFRSN